MVKARRTQPQQNFRDLSHDLRGSAGRQLGSTIRADQVHQAQRFLRFVTPRDPVVMLHDLEQPYNAGMPQAERSTGGAPGARQRIARDGFWAEQRNNRRSFAPTEDQTPVPSRRLPGRP
jgi:hypothetical protein